ncbi:hypothetical protein [Streptomyces sp. NPDC000405]|uniref:hypothetical protein n=1 Tax=Streptomyces sp. NPDC000405 TaxID=3161033 RepID=UPI00398CF8C9
MKITIYSWSTVQGRAGAGAGAGKTAVDQVWAVLDLLEPALHSSGDLVQVGRGEVADVALDQ